MHLLSFTDVAALVHLPPLVVHLPLLDVGDELVVKGPVAFSSHEVVEQHDELHRWFRNRVFGFNLSGLAVVLLEGGPH